MARPSLRVGPLADVQDGDGGAEQQDGAAAEEGDRHGLVLRAGVAGRRRRRLLVLRLELALRPVDLAVVGTGRRRRRQQEQRRQPEDDATHDRLLSARIGYGRTWSFYLAAPGPCQH